MSDEYDAKVLLKPQSISVLDKGSVSIVDFHPRICPTGYTPEFRIVQAARVSFGKGLTTPAQDNALIRYLFLNKHTSPIEMVGVTLLLVVPKAIAIHFLRHRTGKFNEFSQRYAEIKDDSNFYDPTVCQNGIRVQSKVNKQGSDSSLDVEQKSKIEKLMKKANGLVKQQHDLYHQMIEAGCAKEIARFHLPMSEYTTMYVQFDLSNLIKMLGLRADKHAQWETQEYANAIAKLCRPLFPTVFQAFEEQKNGLFLSEPECLAFTTGQDLATESKSEMTDFKTKIKRLLPKSLTKSLVEKEKEEPALKAEKEDAPTDVLASEPVHNPDWQG